MTWVNALRMTIGLALVLALVAAATYVLDRRESQTTSPKASIAALTYAVGTDYAGTVTESFVEEGDWVAAGDPVVAFHSLALAHDIEVGLIDPETANFDITEDGLMTLTAPTAGTVVSTGPLEGSFAPTGTVLATIEQQDSLFVEAELDLSPRDYERLQQGAAVTITLPDQSQLSGTLQAWDVTAVEDRASAVVRVQSNELVAESANGLVRAGVPVTVSVALRNDGVLASVRTTMVDFIRKVGL